MKLPSRATSRFPAVLSSSSWGGRTTRAEVNLDAVADNVRALRRHVRSPELLAVVKANGYGHGSAEIARTVLSCGATRLGVYTVGEGVDLRKAGISKPVQVFGAFESAEARLVVKFGLTPTVLSVEAAEAIQATAPNRQVPYHVKIDTGLSRSGIRPDDAAALLRRLSEFPSLRLEGVFTHFARADEPGQSETTRQFGVFLKTCETLEAAGFTIPIKHAANSGATLEHSEMHLDMVRCGICIYGYYPSVSPIGEVALTPALSLLTSIVRLQQLPPGAGVGYGHEFTCSRETLLALIPIGYGDGLPRSLGRGNGRVLVRGRTAPIVGRVSMDQITVDVTDIPAVALHDDAVLIGGQDGAVHSADDLASEAGTISYDVLTGIMPRVPRLYVRDSLVRPSLGPD